MAIFLVKRTHNPVQYDNELDSPLYFQMTYTEPLPRREMEHKGPADLELGG